MNLSTRDLIRRDVSLRFIFTVAIVCSLCGLTGNGSVAAAPAEPAVGGTGGIFGGSNLGAIPDGTGPCWNPGTGAPRNVTFNATGLTGPINHVSISMTFGSPIHTHMGDITATLIAPNGASHTIFGHTGATTSTGAGDSSDLGTSYIFTDTASSPPSGGWW